MAGAGLASNLLDMPIHPIHPILPRFEFMPARKFAAGSLTLTSCITLVCVCIGWVHDGSFSAFREVCRMLDGNTQKQTRECTYTENMDRRAGTKKLVFYLKNH